MRCENVPPKRHVWSYYSFLSLQFNLILAVILCFGKSLTSLCKHEA